MSPRSKIDTLYQKYYTFCKKIVFFGMISFLCIGVYLLLVYAQLTHTYELAKKVDMTHISVAQISDLRDELNRSVLLLQPMR